MFRLLLLINARWLICPAVYGRTRQHPWGFDIVGGSFMFPGAEGRFDGEP